MSNPVSNPVQQFNEHLSDTGSIFPSEPPVQRLPEPGALGEVPYFVLDRASDVFRRGISDHPRPEMSVAERPAKKRRIWT